MAEFLRSRHLFFFIGLFIFSSCVYAAHIFKVQSILWGDSRYYYAFTRSIVVDHDLNFDNEAFLPNLGFPNPPLFSPATNRITNKFSPGAPLLWVPGFVLGEGLSLIQGYFFPQSELAGYGWLTVWTVGVSATAFSVGGLYLFFLVLKQKFGVELSLFSSAVLLLTTQLFFYTAIDPLNSHSASFFISGLLFFLSSKWIFGQPKSTWVQVGIIGLTAGWLALIRNQDIIFCIPIGVSMLLKEKKSVENLIKLGLFGIATFAPLLIQFSFTYYLYGQYSSGYLLGGEQLQWLNPDFGRVLLSSGNGFFFFAPIVFLFIWGLLKAARRGDRIAQVGTCAFLLATYVIASWGPEMLGGPYGSRMFTSILPWLGYGGAALFKEYWPQRQARYAILLLIFVCLINTMGQTIYMLLKH